MRRVLPVVVLLSSCAHDKPAAPASQAPEPAPAAPPVTLPAASAPEPGELPPLFVEMVGHYVAARAAADAIIVGDTARARSILVDLGDREVHPDIPEPLQMYAHALKSEAHAAVSAENVGEVANVLTHSLVWCGKCHVAAEVPFRQAPAPVPEGEDVRAHMQRHAWVAGRMWDAIVAGDPKAWQEAVAVLREAPTAPDTVPHAPDRTGAVDVMARKVHDLQLDAADAQDVWDQADVVATLYATCADCHRETGGPR